jgi:hypothetical protein
MSLAMPALSGRSYSTLTIRPIAMQANRDVLCWYVDQNNAGRASIVCMHIDGKDPQVCQYKRRGPAGLKSWNWAQ